MTSLELARSAAKPPANLEAYDLVLQGRALAARLGRADNVKARGLFERATELDPKYAPAYVGLGRVEIHAVTEGWTANPSEALERAEGLARRAIALDDLHPEAHTLVAEVALQFGEYDRALDEVKRAIDLNGSDAHSYNILMYVLLFRGDLEGAISAGETLSQFEPEIPNRAAFLLAVGYVLADRGADAVRILEHALDRSPSDLYANVMLAGAYAEAGRQPDASRQAADVRRRFPNFSPEEFGSLLRDPNQREKLATALKKAGL